MKRIFSLILLLASTSGFAGVHLEPYLGFSFGSHDYTSGGTAIEKSYTTPHIGGRIGYGMLGLSGGLDFNMSLSSFSMDVDTPAGQTDTDEYTNSNFGLFVAYKLPVMLRFFASYYLSSHLEVDKSATASNVGDLYKGNGFNLGAGFTGFPIISVNLEYRKITYDEFEDKQTGTTTKLGASEREVTEIILSVSAPFDF